MIAPGVIVIDELSQARFELTGQIVPQSIKDAIEKARPRTEWRKRNGFELSVPLV